MENDTLGLLRRTFRLTVEGCGNLYVSDLPEELLAAWIEPDMKGALEKVALRVVHPSLLLNDPSSEESLSVQAFFCLFCPERRGWLRSKGRSVLRAQKLFVEMQYILRVLALARSLPEPLRLFSLSHFAGYGEVLEYLAGTRSGKCYLPFLEYHRPALSPSPWRRLSNLFSLCRTPSLQ